MSMTLVIMCAVLVTVLAVFLSSQAEVVEFVCVLFGSLSNKAVAVVTCSVVGLMLVVSLPTTTWIVNGVLIPLSDWISNNVWLARRGRAHGKVRESPFKDVVDDGEPIEIMDSERRPRAKEDDEHEHQRRPGVPTPKLSSTIPNIPPATSETGPTTPEMSPHESTFPGAFGILSESEWSDEAETPDESESECEGDEDPAEGEDRGDQSEDYDDRDEEECEEDEEGEEIEESEGEENEDETSEEADVSDTGSLTDESAVGNQPSLGSEACVSVASNDNAATGDEISDLQPNSAASVPNNDEERLSSASSSAVVPTSVPIPTPTVDTPYTVEAAQVVEQDVEAQVVGLEELAANEQAINGDASIALGEAVSEPAPVDTPGSTGGSPTESVPAGFSGDHEQPVVGESIGVRDYVDYSLGVQQRESSSNDTAVTMPAANSVDAFCSTPEPSLAQPTQPQTNDGWNVAQTPQWNANPLADAPNEQPANTATFQTGLPTNVFPSAPVFVGYQTPIPGAPLEAPYSAPGPQLFPAGNSWHVNSNLTNAHQVAYHVEPQAYGAQMIYGQATLPPYQQQVEAPQVGQNIGYSVHDEWSERMAATLRRAYAAINGQPVNIAMMDNAAPMQAEEPVDMDLEEQQPQMVAEQAMGPEISPPSSSLAPAFVVTPELDTPMASPALTATEIVDAPMCSPVLEPTPEPASYFPSSPTMDHTPPAPQPAAVPTPPRRTILSAMARRMLNRWRRRAQLGAEVRPIKKVKAIKKKRSKAGPTAAPRDTSHISYYSRIAWRTALKSVFRVSFPDCEATKFEPQFKIPDVPDMWAPPPSASAMPAGAESAAANLQGPQAASGVVRSPALGLSNDAPTAVNPSGGPVDELAQMFAGAMDKFRDTRYSEAAETEVAEFLAAHRLNQPPAMQTAKDTVDSNAEDDLPALEDGEREDGGEGGGEGEGEDGPGAETHIEVELEGGDNAAAEAYLAKLGAELFGSAGTGL
ncbi:hypothetical protein FRC08_016306 [Ceratobasidium sp. 394]|nr:hypothetical protein FRC08_016306 [Ceratobasidium sp. 394]